MFANGGHKIWNLLLKWHVTPRVNVFCAISNFRFRTGSNGYSLSGYARCCPNWTRTVLILLQKVGNPPYFHQQVREFLNQHLPQQWIRHGTNDNQIQFHVIYFYGAMSRIKFIFLFFPQISWNWRYKSELPLKPSPLTYYKKFGTNLIIM